MAYNFDIHAWNRNRLIEGNLEAADLLAKKRVDTIYNQIINDFPDLFESSIDKSQLKFSISTAFVTLSLDDIKESDDPKLGGELEAGVIGDKVEEGIDNKELESDLKSKLEALVPDISVTMGTYLASGEGYGSVTIPIKKDLDENLFKRLIGIIESEEYKVDLSQSDRYFDTDDDRYYYPKIKFSWDPKDLTEEDKPLPLKLQWQGDFPSQQEVDNNFSSWQREIHYLAHKPVEEWDEYDLSNYKSISRKGGKYGFNSIKETIKIVMENPEGFSKYFPDGKTKGLTSDELSTILTRIAKDIEDDGKKLDESTLCKRGQEYIKARKAAGEKSSAYLSGRAVKVCKGDIKFKGKKQKDFKNESLDEYVDNGPEEKAFDVEMEKAGNGIASAIEKELKNKNPQELNEALITSVIAGILTGNSLIGFISKLSKLLFKKIGFKKGEDIAGKIQHWAHDNEIAFQKPIKRVLGFFIKDTKTLDIVTKGIYAIVVGSMAANYGAEAVSSLSKSDWFASSLNALKTLAKSDETIVNAYPAIRALI